MKKESLFTTMPKLIMAVSLIVGIGAVLGMLGYFGTMSESEVVVNNEAEKKEVQDEEIIQDETTDWQTYRNEGRGFEIKYPSDWSISPINSISEGFGLNKTLVISKYVDRMAIKIILSDSEEVGYYGHAEGASFIKTIPKSIVVGDIKGTIYEYRISGCDDDNKMENDDGYLCYHSKRTTLFVNNLYYIFDTSYVGSDRQKITDRIIETIKFLKIPQKIIFQDQENEVMFDYPGHWGNYYIKEHIAGFEKDRGITYSFQNNLNIHVALENKAFNLEHQGGLYNNYLLDGLPISFEGNINIDNYCDKNRNKSLSCKKYNINKIKKGILEDRAFCIASPTGGGISCSYYRFFFIATENKEFPIFVITMRIMGGCDYESYQNLNLTEDCLKEKYKEYFDRHEKELNEFDQILSTFRFIEK